MFLSQSKLSTVSLLFSLSSASMLAVVFPLLLPLGKINIFTHWLENKKLKSSGHTWSILGLLWWSETSWKELIHFDGLANNSVYEKFHNARTWWKKLDVLHQLTCNLCLCFVVGKQRIGNKSMCVREDEGFFVQCNVDKMSGCFIKTIHLDDKLQCYLDVWL